jgi:hypothetical protein
MPLVLSGFTKLKESQSTGNIDRYKARLVANGYAQKHHINYKETFAPTSYCGCIGCSLWLENASIGCKDNLRIITIRTVVALAAHYGWKMHQLDVKITFLNGDLQDEVYVETTS